MAQHANYTLYLDADGLHVCENVPQTEAPAACFPNTDEGHAAFARFLQAHARHHLQLLVNLPHEQTLPDSIPRLHGKDRQTLIQRRLEQHFPGNRLRMAESTGQESTTGKEGLRLSAFTRQENFAPWLAAIDRQNSCLLGIYSVSQLAVMLLQKLDIKATTCLVFIRDGQNLRQYLVRQQQVTFCRHLALPDHAPADLDGDLSTLQTFLSKQHLLGQDESLPIYALGFSQTQAISPAGEIHYLSTQQPLSALYLDCLKTHRPKANFASTEHLKAGQQARLHLVSQICTGLLALSALTFAAMQHLEKSDLDTARKEMATETAQLASQPLPAPPDLPLAHLRELTTRHQSLQDEQRTPHADFEWLSRALNQHPAILLDKLDWKNAAGEPYLRIEGRIEANIAADSQPPESARDEFLATLRVDRKKQVNEISQAEKRPAAFSGSTDTARSTLPLLFIIEIRNKT